MSQKITKIEDCPHFSKNKHPKSCQYCGELVSLDEKPTKNFVHCSEDCPICGREEEFKEIAGVVPPEEKLSMAVIPSPRNYGKAIQSYLDFFEHGRKGKAVIYHTPEGTFYSPKAMKNEILAHNARLIERFSQQGDCLVEDPFENMKEGFFMETIIKVLKESNL